MNPLVFLIFGLLLGFSFKYFPTSSLLLTITPPFFYLYKRKYLIAIFSCIMIFFGIIYTSLFDGKEREKSNILKGYIISKNDSSYLFKNHDGEVINLFYPYSLEFNKIYGVSCSYPKVFKNPYELYSHICFARQIWEIEEFKGDFFEEIRQKINESTKKVLKPEIASLLNVMTIGAREKIPPQLRESFQKTGLIHLLSISGAHFSLLFTSSFLLFNFIVKRLPYTVLVRMTLYIKPSQLTLFFSFSVIFTYFLLVQSNYPSTRAFIMATLFILGVFTERKTIWLKTLLIACLIILLMNPDAVKNLSFQLSFLATLGVGFASDLYKSLKGKISNRFISYLILSLLISIAATLTTAPLVILKFHYLSLIGPLANITAGLIIGLILFPLHIFSVFMLLTLGIYPFAELINTIGYFSLNLIDKLASFNFSTICLHAVMPGSVLTFYFAMFLALLNFYKLKRKVFYIFSSILLIASILINLSLDLKDKDSLKITFLDVGHADSTVIEYKNKVFVVDTGKTGAQLEYYLRAKGYKKIEALILTHSDSDHIGGFERLLKKFEINEIWDNSFITYNDALKVRHLQRGDLIKYEDCCFTILHPYKDFYSPSLEKSSNELSLVFTLKCFKNRYLFTADAGKYALSSIPTNYLNTDFIKVPHHGSKYSFFEEFYKAVSPKVCIISTDRDNLFKHPSSEVVNFLKGMCKIYETDLDGAIQIRESLDGNISIKTFSSTQLTPLNCCFKSLDSELKNLKKLFILW